MKNPQTFLSTTTIARLLIALAIVGALATSALAQQTPGGTTISNQASASYTDGTNTYNTISNTVTVTVSKVAGLAITPDAGSNPTVVAGQTAVLFNFTLTNTGNFNDQVHFVPGSAHLGGTATATITRTFACGTPGAVPSRPSGRGTTCDLPMRARRTFHDRTDTSNPSFL